jgi:hypothetical protein
MMMVVSHFSVADCAGSEDKPLYLRVLSTSVPPFDADVFVAGIRFHTSQAKLPELLAAGSRITLHHVPSKPGVMAAGSLPTKPNEDTQERPRKSSPHQERRRRETPPKENDSCKYGNNGVCDEYRYGGDSCADKTDTTDCSRCVFRFCVLSTTCTNIFDH